MNKKDFGQRLKALRQQKGMTQFELAEKIDMHEKHISRIESGIYFPSFDNIIKIMDILEVEWKDFDLNIKNKEIDPIKNKAYKIIQRAGKKESKIYLTVLEDLQKIIKD